MADDLKKISNAILIDDNEFDHLMYERIVARSNRIENLISFTYADEALEFLKTNDRISIDVIFLDINMPRMNGFEFLEAATHQLGESFTDAVIVMLTTSLAEEDKERAKQYNIVKAYINKPLTTEDIDFVTDKIVYGVQVVSMAERSLKAANR